MSPRSTTYQLKGNSSSASWFLNCFVCRKLRGTDMTVISKTGKGFPASRLLLACQSPVLHAMLLSDMKEGRTKKLRLPYPDIVVKKFVSLLNDVHVVDTKFEENLAYYLGKIGKSNELSESFL